VFHPLSLWSLLVLIVDIWAIVNVLQSAVDTTKKAIWTLVILLLPVLGVVLWFFLGPRTGKT
jgi:phospholipase D-like protein